MSMNDVTFLTVFEVARRLRICRGTVLNLVAGGELHATNLGLGPKRRMLRVSEIELARFLERRNAIRPTEEVTTGLDA